MKTLFVLVVMLALAAPAYSGPPNSGTGRVLEVWATVALNAYRNAEGRLVVVDCFENAEKRAPAVWRPALPDLAAASAAIIRDLRPELARIARERPANDLEALRAVIRTKANWSPETRYFLVNIAAGFPVAVQSLGPCDTGRCDCSTAGCEPPNVCDCETSEAGPDGLPLPCKPPRGGCNVQIIYEPLAGFELELAL